MSWKNVNRFAEGHNPNLIPPPLPVASLANEDFLKNPDVLDINTRTEILEIIRDVYGPLKSEPNVSKNLSDEGLDLTKLDPVQRARLADRVVQKYSHGTPSETPMTHVYYDECAVDDRRYLRPKLLDRHSAQHADMRILLLSAAAAAAFALCLYKGVSALVSRPRTAPVRQNAFPEQESEPPSPSDRVSEDWRSER